MTMQSQVFDQIGDAANALSSNQSARYFGGGTLVMRAVNSSSQSFDTIIRSTDPSLKQIQVQGDQIVIGAGVTMSQVMANRDLDFLTPAAKAIGGPAIRNMATVGGNLFARSPYGDFTAALLVLEAAISLVGSQSNVPLADFLTQRYREPRPVVASISVPRPRDKNAFHFVKITRVKPMGIALITIAAMLPQTGGRISNARVAYGAMGDFPIRAAAVERALEGKILDAQGIEAALAVATEGISPQTDEIATEWYRREVAPIHLKRLLLGAGG